MTTIDEFIKEVPSIKQGIELRDFLLGYENYYLESCGNFALLTPEFVTLTNVERLYIDLHAPFASFHMPIYGFIVVPSQHVSVEELLEISPIGSKKMVAPNGEKAIRIPLT